MSFKKCRSVYPVKIIKPFNRYKYDEQQELADFFEDLNDSDMILDTCVCDSPKRGVLKNVKTYAARHGCDYCECPAVSFKDSSMSKIQLTWPPSTMNGRPRTITAMRRIVDSIENEDENLTKEYVKGVKGRSVLLNQPRFDLFTDINAEYMHLVCLGVVKKVVGFIYKIGKNRTRVTKRKRTDPKLYNDLIILVKVPGDYSRRCRNLDPSVFKAQEYRNIVLVFFPIVLKNIDEKYKKERQLWLCLVFMIRSCTIPNEEYEFVCKDTILKSCELFFNLYFELYGQKHCSCSIHIVSSHLLKVRGNVPFTERSAFKFESFYSEMKNLYKPGTLATPKQILQNTYMKRSIEHHVCQKTIKYEKQNDSPKMEDNSLIYTFNDGKFDMYVIQSIEGEEFTCRKQGKFEFNSPLLPNHKWNTIGVYRKGPIGVKTFKLNKNNVKGKVISVLNMLITCPINVLNEK